MFQFYSPFSTLKRSTFRSLLLKFAVLYATLSPRNDVRILLICFSIYCRFWRKFNELRFFQVEEVLHTQLKESDLFGKHEVWHLVTCVLSKSHQIYSILRGQGLLTEAVAWWPYSPTLSPWDLPFSEKKCTDVFHHRLQQWRQWKQVHSVWTASGTKACKI